MHILTVSNKEAEERNRQVNMFRNYFDEKRELLERRQAKFLSLYPYSGLGVSADMHKFKSSVLCASPDEMSYIYKAFENEQRYWKSSYAENNCNYRVYIHIIKTLTEMSNIIESSKNAGANGTLEPSATMRHVVRDSHVQVNNVNVGNDSSDVESNNVNTNHWGKPGEDAVDYVLKWLPNEYSVIEKNCSGKYGDNIILLENPSFVDESQEYDHIVIGPQGIFNIETKNYSGKISIDKSGNWLRLKRGEVEWVSEENPAQQLFRHHVLLQSIVGDHVPIIDVVCMSNPSLLIVGQENSNVPVIKKDLLADFIVGYRSAGLSSIQRKTLESRINACKKNCM